MIRLAALALLVLLAGCALFRRHKPPIAAVHYTVGEPYQAGGTWYYPQERMSYTATGLAAVAAMHTGLTADGEMFDAQALAGAHQTLQLPAILRVTNLENGRQVLIRLNDRGPAPAARVVALTPHAAALLQAADGTRVRLELDEGMTQSLAEQLGGGPRVAVTAAPREAVQAESLPPPAGAVQSSRIRQAAGGAPAVSGPAPVAAIPAQLPGTVVQGLAEPGELYLRASEFGRASYAQQFAARIGGAVERVREGRTETYRVRAGPYATVHQAEAALDQALAAGVIDARIVVEP